MKSAKRTSPKVANTKKSSKPSKKDIPQLIVTSCPVHLVGMVDEVFVTIPFPSISDAQEYLECLHFSARKHHLDVDVYFYIDGKLDPALIITRSVH